MLRNVHAPFPENASTASQIKVADIAVTDVDGGANNLSLSGADAGLFRIDRPDAVAEGRRPARLRDQPASRRQGQRQRRRRSAARSTPSPTWRSPSPTSPRPSPAPRVADRLVGHSYGETINGLAGNDTIFGNGGNDRISAERRRPPDRRARQGRLRVQLDRRFGTWPVGLHQQRLLRRRRPDMACATSSPTSRAARTGSTCRRSTPTPVPAATRRSPGWARAISTNHPRRADLPALQPGRHRQRQDHRLRRRQRRRPRRLPDRARPGSRRWRRAILSCEQ